MRHCGAFASPNRADESACLLPCGSPLPLPPCTQVMDFAERMRAAEAEKAGLEAEIQVSWSPLQPPHKTAPAAASTMLSAAALPALLSHCACYACCAFCCCCFLQGLRDQAAPRRAEADKELRRKERLEREMKDLVGGCPRQLALAACFGLAAGMVA